MQINIFKDNIEHLEMGSLLQGVLANCQEDRLFTKVDGTQDTSAVRGLLDQRVDGGVVCTLYAGTDDKNEHYKTSNPISVSVNVDEGRVCQLCNVGNKGKELGKVLCFHQNSNDETALYFHHPCATLASNGNEIVMTELVNALDVASRRRCSICFEHGAYIQCSYGDCCKCYHLQCAMNATDVVIDLAHGQLYCPKHTVPDSDESADEEQPAKNRGKRCKTFVSYDFDDDFSLSLKKPRSFNGTSRIVTKSSKRRDASGRSKGNGNTAQRPRTDWQRRGADTWVKVVPPWWCEQKTVHFANKVFRELFDSGKTIELIDDKGARWICDVVAETRNDLRLQYTLKGQFQDLWDSISITPGDVLTFEKLHHLPHTIRLAKHENGKGFEELVQMKQKKRIVQQSMVSELPCLTMPKANKVVSETPWSFVDENTAIKVLQASNLAKMKCSIPDGIWRKIFNKPDMGNTFAVYDASLKKHFVFDMECDTRSERHIIGKGFMSWLVETAVKPEDGIQISVSSDAIRVSKLASSDMRKPVDSSTDTLTTCSSTSMDTLAAAAFYARTHGTPGIKAILYDCSSEQPATEEEQPHETDIKGNATIKDDKDAPNNIVINMKNARENKMLCGKPIILDSKQNQMVGIPSSSSQISVDQKLSLASFHATMQVISRHEWTEEENRLILKFHAKYASLDYLGREITSYSILQFKDNKPVLLEILKSFVASIPGNGSVKPEK